jgi:hypothetical protein
MLREKVENYGAFKIDSSGAATLSLREQNERNR